MAQNGERARREDVKTAMSRGAALHTDLGIPRDCASRAIRRCGELLTQTEPAHGANQNIMKGAVPKITRESVATTAGVFEPVKNSSARRPISEEQLNVAATGIPADRLAPHARRHSGLLN